jgi:hypothetical protein
LGSLMVAVSSKFVYQSISLLGMTNSAVNSFERRKLLLLSVLVSPPQHHSSSAEDETINNGGGRNKVCKQLLKINKLLSLISSSPS